MPLKGSDFYFVMKIFKSTNKIYETRTTYRPHAKIITNTEITPHHLNILKVGPPRVCTIDLARIAQGLDSAIQHINHYPSDKFYRNPLSYLVDSASHPLTP